MEESYISFCNINYILFWNSEMIIYHFGLYFIICKMMDLHEKSVIR